MVVAILALVAEIILKKNNEKTIITRGISKKTGEYGKINEHVFFFDALANAFELPTRLIGEVYLDNGIDKNVGSILRSLPHKAKSIQDNEYYREISKTVKFTAKDKRDIENNEFAGQKLKFRIFDCWYYNGENLMDTPWIERQKYVQEASKRINHPLVSAVAYKPMTEIFYDEKYNLDTDGGEIFGKDGEIKVMSTAKYTNGIRSLNYGPIPRLVWNKNWKADYETYVSQVENGEIFDEGKTAEDFK